MTPPAAIVTQSRSDTLPRDLSSKDAFDSPLGKLTGYEEIIKEYYARAVVQRASDYEFDYLRAGYPPASWEPLEGVALPEDRGLYADPEYKELFSAATEVEHITPKFGTILHGVNLNKLTDNQKDELARLVSFRGVVFFRNQDADVDELLDLGSYYGPLHVNGSTPTAKSAGSNEKLFQINAIDSTSGVRLFKGTISQTDLWHSDVAYELQPPGYAILKMLVVPPVGSDTLWTSGYATYDDLSRPFAEYLEELTASHTSQFQVDGMKRQGHTSRRPAITVSHPLVRTHPVTGWKSVFASQRLLPKLTMLAAKKVRFC